MSKAITRLLRHDQTVHREIDGAIQYNDIIEECRKKFDGASQWSLEDWISTLARGGGGAKKMFQYCLNSNSSNHSCTFDQFKDIQEIMLLILSCKTNVLLPKGFTEYIYHVGNAKELSSIIRSGLIPGGKSLERGRQAVFFTVVNPMEDGNGMGETPRDLTKPRIAPYKNTWKRIQKTVFFQFEVRLRERLAVFTRHGHMRSFSATHYLQLALRKRYV